MKIRWLPSAALLAICLAGPATAAAPPESFVRPPDPAATARTLARLETLGPEAAETKLWVFFTDKGFFDRTSYEAALERFAAGIDMHAAARRAKTFGASLGGFHDLPVHPTYRAALERLGATVLRESRWLNAVSSRAPLDAGRAVAARPFVREIAFVRSGRSIRPIPGDASAPPARNRVRSFDYGPSFDQLEEIGVPMVHDLGYSGAGVVVAMLDTGYQRDHQAFARILSEGRLLDQWDFIDDDGETQNEPGDPDGQDLHGTATWSILAGFEEGELIGPAYGASFLLAKTEDITDETPIEEDNWVAAMEWADEYGADVLSSSLSYIDWYQYSDMDGDTAVTSVAADVAASRGIVVCTSMGNWGTQDWYYMGAPADADSVISVGATRPDGGVWDDSSHGPTYDGRIKPEVCARGDETYGAWPIDLGGPYRTLSGTSVSCPLVAGCAALILEVYPDWTAMQVREALMTTADNAGAPNNDRGWGRIDVNEAIGGATDAPDVPPTAALRILAAPNPSVAGTEVRLRLPDPTGSVTLFSAGGKRLRRLDDPAGAGGGILWDGRDESGDPLPPGVYFVRWRSGGETASTKLIRSTR
ncbi:MAG: S8 family serine peptidase [Candidatus Latescibacteria bacterium]|nr:S8 family serine peptidase [Candidatus Latescibacterota bacterium]